VALADFTGRVVKLADGDTLSVVVTKRRSGFALTA
jgi:hypothetical protein